MAKNDFFWDELLELIEEGCVVPIVGRDLLTIRRDGRDLMLYPWLAGRLAEALEVTGENLPADAAGEAAERRRFDELNTVACRYLERGRGTKWQRIYAALKRVMPADEELPVPEPLKQLARILPFQLYVTTTFDSLLRRALDEARFGGRPKTEELAFSPNRWDDLPCELERLERPAVYHLFGRLSATPTFAVTEEDTLEFVHSLQSEGKPDLLLDELESKNLLLLGSGIRGWLARFFLRAAKRQRLRSLRDTTDYFVDAEVAHDANLAVFLRNFSSGSEIFEGGEAVEFVDELYRRWVERHPPGEAPASPAPRLAARGIEPGSVFLSYASEDREAVLILKQALESAGVDVFYDKQVLEAGDDFEARLKRAIRGCSLFLPVISEHTLTGLRRFFRREWSLALDEALAAAGRFILPVVIDATPPESEAIPEPFRRLHWEGAPGGRPSAGFVTLVKQEFRSYQKSLARAS